jgi:hypothetical protein
MCPNPKAYQHNEQFFSRVQFLSLPIPVKTATCSGNNLTTFQSSNSLVDSNTKVAGLRQLFVQIFLAESPFNSILWAL